MLKNKSGKRLLFCIADDLKVKQHLTQNNANIIQSNNYTICCPLKLDTYPYKKKKIIVDHYAEKELSDKRKKCLEDKK